ncbi:flagellar biosynthesis repressor FlbT [Cohaesibacter celericrescens]|jgi:flagellar protein FlbT|uniref:Flagellar biosynthesis repressor FlbT n=1 Tax=Cohaesibacter celericrescens TaxID=2067669 RepID=A0A2N5XM06_9HYPH|nr:flagellar biosynthesis repressor FlbT [Cohaesibacter celericrescens]PLW75523.1 flagellar biosynthesis repressor FlbT [Cohaesibacter celericrescens]PLW78930.1 flagellar biosynthesis repressor FlbT [Cohaesibacter celericrescens]
MKPLQLTFKSGERFYVNGAVIRFPKKTTVELLNNVEFLLESQIMQISETTTPLRQLYFVAQMLLTSPSNTDDAHATFMHFSRSLAQTLKHYRLCAGVQEVVDMVNAGSTYEAMKKIRALYPLEASILDGSALHTTESLVQPQKAAAAANYL